ncbi:MAG: Protein of unknown function (DUF2953) [Clostridium sp. Maddingley MBC34-26]|uniref:DUF2953 domain-containing protein n=2 Tax=unclassified Clostridium TaxID=2614128 RepID=UPI0002986E82|nr:MAG: Protein of unknown function (DUF2953) [Clostridium sp. Maddingley MBC34-26]
MKLFIFIFWILLILIIPLPIKISIYYSTKDYYIKLYKITLVSKKKRANRIRYDAINKKPIIKKERKFLSRFYRNINTKTLMNNLYNLNLKFKPLLKLRLSLDYSLSDAARTALFYGILTQFPPIIYTLLKRYFKINKFKFNINPIFEDIFLLKIETTSIIFLSFANIIYITIIFFKLIKSRGGDP